MSLELSLFLDESGSDALDSKYYLLVVVMHEQSCDLSLSIGKYEDSLREKGLPDIPLHASPLMNGKDGYAGLDPAARKRLLSAFFSPVYPRGRSPSGARRTARSSCSRPSRP